MFGCNEKFHFLEIHFLLTNIYSFDPELIYTLIFGSNHFRKKRERERERERRESPDRREREEEERAGAIVRRAIVRRARRNKPAIVRRARSSADRAPRRSRLRACSSIAPRVGRSHRSRLQSRQGPRDLIFSSAAPIFSSDLACTDLMNFFAGFCFFCE